MYSVRRRREATSPPVWRTWLRVCPLAPVLLAITTSCAPPAEAPHAEPTRPNVLLLVIDTLRTDHLSSYGYRWPTTPAIDALAQRGVRFNDCTSGASWTMPSMISLMTGRRLLTTIYKVPEEHTMLAEGFSQGGYRTGGFVANSLLANNAGFHRGMDSWAVRKTGTGRWGAPKVLTRAQNFLSLADDRPFFLWLHFLDTHTPYQPKTVPWKRKASELFNDAEQATIAAVIESTPPAEAEWLSYQQDTLAQEVDRYDGALAELDGHIGSLLAELKDSGQLENTYVVLVSDHGETLFRRAEHPTRLNTMRDVRSRNSEKLRLTDYLKQEHDGTVFQELVRTAFVVAGPGITAAPGGRVEEAMVSNLDVMPTLLGLANLAPGASDGRNLAPYLLQGDPVPDAEWVTSAASHQLTARLSGGTKLVLPSANWQKRWGDLPALYDLNNDPGETSPLPLGPKGEALQRRLEEAAEGDVHRSWDGSQPDGETLTVLRELGYIR
ncbi:MAG: arylsulfatase A-like enzyme [Pseudohongiellaceae bacterium]|jgi:arylsulfatase A-like enzyme